jgi:hypothetical protein
MRSICSACVISVTEFGSCRRTGFAHNLGIQSAISLIARVANVELYDLEGRGLLVAHDINPAASAYTGRYFTKYGRYTEAPVTGERSWC